MAIGVDQIYLSMTSPDTGEYLTANVYTVDGVYEPDGVTPRRLSIGQLVMALCLQRAAALERQVIEKMAAIENTISKARFNSRLPSSSNGMSRTLMSGIPAKLSKYGRAGSRSK